ncbi:hypothetical protein [Polynucleobacter sp. UK-Kesae-W10]|uniref:hypothetical protein n=1 Tax=Polynucleobacter sp. UK-Kesae-W10 TaxID=1819738 RepID=UPI001C0E3A03|nr:hypothetical protein [Polynucleobacter sp. UK-Kesae-W10]MBU3577794.1 hypothetical protein [Polynucleobacter sp. UK-Kesae-W10]
MTNFLQTFALAEMAITCAILCIWVMQKVSTQLLPTFVKALFVLVLANAFFWPLGFSLELPLAGYVRGITGDLSIVTTLLLWSALLKNHKPAPLGFKLSVAIIALVFYPLALGLGMIDPYAWGYGSIALLIAVLICALICGLTNWTQGVWIIALAIIAWAFGLQESTNLWDYLLDPFLAIWAIFSVVSNILRARKEKARSGYLFRPG